MKIIRNDSETTLDYINCGDTFSLNINGIDIYIKTGYTDDYDGILCVNIETGDYRFLGKDNAVFPVQCSVSVKA